MFPLVKEWTVPFYSTRLACLIARRPSPPPGPGGPHGLAPKCSVVYTRLSPRGSRTIDRMTNVPGSRRLHRGLVNQEIFSISMSRETLLFSRFLYSPLLSLFRTNTTRSPPPSRRGARQPHAKNNAAATLLRARERTERLSRVNLARRCNCAFFPIAAYVTWLIGELLPRG